MDTNSLTSLKFLNAWMPPAVAHAPIVIRYFDARRTAWIRSASCGVVMDPSTNDRSYGPFTTFRDASGKYAISTCPVMASNSFSQSRRLSWQPSQEANFQTASLGLRFSGMSDLSHRDQRLDSAPAEHRTILAYKSRPELAMPAETDGTFHIPFHGDVDIFRFDASLFEFTRGKAHHYFRATDHSHCVTWIEWRSRYQCRDYSYGSTPCPGGSIDGCMDGKPEAGLPLLQLLLVQDVGGGARTVQKDNVPISFPMCHDVVQSRTQGCQSDSTGHDHQVCPRSLLDGPVTSKRAPYSQHVTRAEFPHRPGYHAHFPGRMYQHVGLGWIPADGNWHLSYAEDIEHVELPGRKRKLCRLLRFQLQRKSVVRFTPHPAHRVGLGNHRMLG